MRRVAGLGCALLLLAGCSHGAAADSADSALGLGYRTVAAGAPVEIKGMPIAGFPAPSNRREVKVINLWAVWCGPCRQEAPILRTAQSQLAGQDVEFISVNAHDNESKAGQFASQYGLRWPQLYDKNGAMLLAQHFAGMPNTLIVDRSGNLTGVFTGPVPSVASLVAAVNHAKQV